MSIQNEIHPVQAEILKGLLFKPRLKFSQLNITGLTSDHFTFHIKKLVELRMVEKFDSGEYGLSEKGKEYANRFDTQTTQLERQAKVTVLVVCVKENKQQRFILFQRRLKQPFYGYLGFISGKIRWGETVVETVARELDEETGLSGQALLKGIEHKMDYDKDGRLLEDKFFYVAVVNNPSGELKDKFEGGENLWIKEGQIKTTPQVFGDVDEVLEIVNSKAFEFIEKKYTVTGY